MVPVLNSISFCSWLCPIPEYPEFWNFKILLRHAQLPHISQDSTFVDDSIVLQ